MTQKRTPGGKKQLFGGAKIRIIVFAGQYYDSETGLHYNYHRYYDPKIGRYLKSDPIGLSGGSNLYSYVYNNPANVIDPYGLIGLDTALKLVGGLVIDVGAIAGGVAGAAIAIIIYPGQTADDDMIPLPPPAAAPPAAPPAAAPPAAPPASEARGGNDPYSLPVVDPGHDGCGKCKPCPPNGPVWRHTHKDGTSNSHQIIYNQKPYPDCRCMPTRIHLP